MAGKVTQVVETRFKSAGAQKIVKETESIGRAQTRLGQASASAGRQFSAQASGLGGLVAAYAGAAATIFAITAAFQALNQAARAEQTITGVNALANAIGESGPKIIKGLQEITKGQLSIVQTAELANLALSSGFSADQINNLAEISLKASRALGRDLTDSFNRLVRGVTKLEPELLDELGIFTRLDPAVEAYAKTLGKTVGSLSNFERRQAFANEVAKEGTEKFKDIDTSANTSAESLEKLSATLSDIGTNVGAFIARALAPLAEALSNPIAAVGAFGILAKTVFGTTFRELGAGLERFEGRLESLSGTIVDKLGGSSRKAAKANEVLGASLTDVNLRSARVSATFDQEFKSLIAKGRAQQLSFTETKRLNSAIAQEIVLLKQESASIAASSLSTTVKEKRTGILNRRLTELNKILASTKVRLNATSKSAQFAARTFAVVSGAAVKFGKGLLSIFNSLTLIITVASVFTTFGAIFLEAFGWLEPTIAFVEDLTRKFRVFLGIQREAIAQAKVAKELGKSADLSDIVVTPGIFGTSILGQSIDLQKGIQKAIQEGATGSAEEFADSLIEGLAPSIQNNLTPQIRAQIESLFTDLFAGIEGIGPASLQGISEFAEATGRTLKTVTQQLTVVGDALRFEGITDLPGNLASVTAKFQDTKDIKDKEALKTAKAQNQTQLEILQSQEVAVNLQEALTSGAANAEQIEKRRSAVLAKIANLRRSEADADKITADRLENTFRLQDQGAQAQLAVLKERDKLLKTFSAEIKAAEKLNEIFTLIVDGERTRVELGITANDKARNRVKLLQEDFELGKAALAQERAGEELEGLRAQRASLARDAQKALVGIFVQTNAEARKLAETLEKISKSLTAQAQKAVLAFSLEQAKRARELADQQATRQKAEIDRISKITQATQKLADVRRKAGEASRKLSQSLVGDLAGQTFQTDRDKRELTLRFAREDLAALQDITVAQLKDIQERADAQEKKLKADIANLEKQVKGGAESLIAKEFEQRKRLEQSEIKIRKQAKLDEITLLEERKKGIAEEAMAFNDHIGGIRDVLAADVVARKEILEGDQFVNNTIKALKAANREDDARSLGFSQDVAAARALRVDLGKGEAEAVAQKGLTDLIERLTATDFENIKKQVDEAFKQEEKLAELRRDIAQNNEILAAEEKLKDARAALEALGINTTAELEAVSLALQNASQDFNNLATVTAGANDNLKTALKGSLDVLEGGLTQGFMDFNNALIQGNLTFNNVAKGFRDLVGNMLRAIQQQVFADTIAKPLSSFISGKVGSFFPTGKAAGGGINGASMRRDRVPAMLEPGEFVMRKDAVKQFGVGTMMRMNAAPRGFSSGSRVTPDTVSRNIPYDPARAAQLMSLGASESLAISIAQEEAIGSVDGGRMTLSNAAVQDRIAGRSGPRTAAQRFQGYRAIRSVQDMIAGGPFSQRPERGPSTGAFGPGITGFVKGLMSIGSGIPEPTFRGNTRPGFDERLGRTPSSGNLQLPNRGTINLQDLLSMQGATPRTTQTAGLFDFLDRGLSNKPEDVKKRQQRFKGGKSKGKGIIERTKEFIKDVTGIQIASLDPRMGPVSARATDAFGAPINFPGGLNLGSRRGTFSGNTRPGFGPASFDPTGDLASVLGADGFRGIPLSIVGSLLGFDVPNLFARAPSPASLSARRARSVVRSRTGTQATGFRGTFQRGDVTTSGNLMTETAPGVVSGIDPFALDRLGYSGSIAATMGGGMGFRAAGSDREFSSIGSFITAALTPGRQSALTTAEFNAMSREGRAGYAPGLGGSRALSASQRAQLSAFGGYQNEPIGGVPQGYTIANTGTALNPVHTIKGGTIRSISDGDGGNNVGGSTEAAAGFGQGFGYEGGFVLASGGLVRKMAAGGAVRSRDRVPALLEPGEFVIRRPMAKAIGGSALNQMNATGKNLTPPNIEVNLNNQGAPKNVSAAAPRVQGDKIIIDMITRDLRNNGPIKKSLRK